MVPARLGMISSGSVNVTKACQNRAKQGRSGVDTSTLSFISLGKVILLESCSGRLWLYKPSSNRQPTCDYLYYRRDSHCYECDRLCYVIGPVVNVIANNFKTHPVVWGYCK